MDAESLTGIYREIAKAIRGISLVRKAADVGDPAAAYYMGGWCMSGNIRKIPENERDAFRYSQTAAKKGYPAAMYRLGQWYLTGTNGVRRDEALGLDWVEKAAFYDVPAAIDFVQKGNGRWRETDFQAAEDREQIDLAKKFLTSTKRPAVADVVADLDMECLFDGVLFDSPEKARRSKAEGEVAENILMGMDKPDGDLLAWHEIQSFNPTVLDKETYLAYIRLAIYGRVGMNLENVDYYVKQGAKCGERVGERILLTEIPEQTVRFLRDATSKNDKYFLQAGGKAIAPDSLTDKVRLAFQIPPDEPIFSVQPSGIHPINPYSEKMTGCVAARSGLYFRGNNRTSGHIPWKEYRDAKIEVEKNSRSSDPPMWLYINRACFMYDHAIHDQYMFLVRLKWLAGVIHKAPGDQKSEAPGPVEPEKAQPLVPKPVPEPVRENPPVPEPPPEPIPERPSVQVPATERQQNQRLCPSCHKPNKPTAKFCSYCGVPLEEPRFCQACGARLRPGKKFCSNCGAKIE